MADPRMQEAYRRVLMGSPLEIGELADIQMNLPEGRRLMASEQSWEAAPPPEAGPSIEEVERDIIDQRVRRYAQELERQRVPPEEMVRMRSTFDPRVQEQKYQQALQNQLTQQAVDVFGAAPKMSGSLMTLPNGSTVDLNDPDEVMMFVDELEAIQMFNEQGGGIPAQVPEQQPTMPAQAPRQAPEAPPAPPGAAVARR